METFKIPILFVIKTLPYGCPVHKKEHLYLHLRPAEVPLFCAGLPKVHYLDVPIQLRFSLSMESDIGG